MSFSYAARLLRMKPDNFYVKYVRTGRLKAVVCGKKRGENFFLLKDIASIVEQEEQILNAAEVATICRVNITCVYKWNISGELKPISGPNVDGFGHNLYLVSDVERLNADRETFKAKRVSEGRSARFGRLPTANRRPVRNVVEPRIMQLVNKWGAKPQRKQISGKRVHNQLIKEGYQVGINTVYVCLRELRQQASSH